MATLEKYAPYLSTFYHCKSKTDLQGSYGLDYSSAKNKIKKHKELKKEQQKVTIGYTSSGGHLVELTKGIDKPINQIVWAQASPQLHPPHRAPALLAQLQYIYPFGQACQVYLATGLAIGHRSSLYIKYGVVMPTLTQAA